METTYESYKKHVCKECKNKATDKCNIKRRYDGTLYCYSYKKE